MRHIAYAVAYPKSSVKPLSPRRYGRLLSENIPDGLVFKDYGIVVQNREWVICDTADHHRI